MPETREEIEKFKEEFERYKEQYAEFLDAAAHDLNAPLRKISSFMERLTSKNKELFNDEAKDYVRRIELSIQEMRALIDNMTELAKAGNGNYQFEDCDLNSVINDVASGLEEEVGQKQIELSIENLPVVKGNKIQYSQLFRNLLENAVKFNESNKPGKISVSSSELTADQKKQHQLPNQKKYFKIEISDNGIGFDEMYAEKIFKPFVRLQPKSQFAGSGLGLTIAKTIVKNHNGIIYAAGKENEGACFSLILPEIPE